MSHPSLSWACQGGERGWRISFSGDTTLGALVLVISYCEAKYGRLGGLRTTDIYLSRFCRLRNPRLRGQIKVSSEEEPLPGCRLLISHRIITWQKIKKGTFINTLISLMKAPPLWLNHLPKASLSNTTTLELRILWRDTKFRFITNQALICFGLWQDREALKLANRRWNGRTTLPCCASPWGSHLDFLFSS